MIESRPRVAQAERADVLFAGTSFLLGFCSVFYIQAVGFIKIIDIAVLIALVPRLSRLAFAHRTFLLLLSCFVVVCLSGLLSPRTASDEIKEYAAGIAALLSFLIVISMNQIELRYLSIGVCVGVTAMLLWSLGSSFAGLPTLGVQHWYYSRFGRSLVGTMSDPNRLALALLFPLTVAISTLRLRKYKIIWLLWMAFLLVGIVLTHSRAGVGFAGMLLLFGLGSRFVKKRGLRVQGAASRLIAVLVVSSILVVLSFGFVTKYGPTKQYLSSSEFGKKVLKKGEDYFDDPRWLLAQLGLRAFADNPFGHGLDGYVNRFHVTSHNTYIEVAVNGGLIGIVLHSFFLGSIGAPIIRKWNRATSEQSSTEDWVTEFRMYLFFTVLAFQVTMQINYLVLAYIMLGVLANTSKRPERGVPFPYLVRDNRKWTRMTSRTNFRQTAPINSRRPKL